MELTDRTDIARVRSGDADAYEALVERHGRALFRLAYRMTGNEQDAEDVVQESFLRAYRQLASFDERASFATWLYRIATNCSLDLMRARKRRAEDLASAEPGAEDPMAARPGAHAGALHPERGSARLRGRGHAGAERGGTYRLRAAAFRGNADGRDQPGAGLPARRGQDSVFRAVRKLRRALEPLVSGVR